MLTIAGGILLAVILFVVGLYALAGIGWISIYGLGLLRWTFSSPTKEAENKRSLEMRHSEEKQSKLALAKSNPTMYEQLYGPLRWYDLDEKI